MSDEFNSDFEDSDLSEGILSSSEGESEEEYENEDENDEDEGESEFDFSQFQPISTSPRASRNLDSLVTSGLIQPLSNVNISSTPHLQTGLPKTFQQPSPVNIIRPESSISTISPASSKTGITPIQPVSGLVSPAITTPVQSSAVKSTVTTPIQPGTVRPIIITPVQSGGIRPTVTTPVQPGAIRPTVTTPVQLGAIRPTVTTPVQLGAIRPTVTTPVQLGGIRPTVTTPVQPGAIRPTVTTPVQSGDIRPTVTTAIQTGTARAISTPPQSISMSVSQPTVTKGEIISGKKLLQFKVQPASSMMPPSKTNITISPTPAIIAQPGVLTMPGKPIVSGPKIMTAEGELIQAEGPPQLTQSKESVDDLLKQDPDEDNSEFKFRQNYTTRITPLLANTPGVTPEMIISLGRSKTNNVFLGTKYPDRMENLLNWLDNQL